MDPILKDRARLWKPQRQSGVSLFKAEFQKYVFAKHFHEDYAIGVIQEGTQRFTLGGGTHIAPSSAMITVNPGEVHDGEAADEMGYRYRVSYIPCGLVKEIFEGLYGEEDAVSYFKSPVTFDRELAGCLLYANRLMELDQNRLMEAQTRLMQVVAEIFLRHGERRKTPRRASRNQTAVDRAVAYIRKNPADNISLGDIAKVAGLSRYHFLRQFKVTTGLSPHAYLIQCRVEMAKRAIERGASLSDAAILAGFSDQSHFSRRFKAIHGFTPGQYRKGMGY